MGYPLENNGKFKNMRLNDQPKRARLQFRIKYFLNILVLNQNGDKA